MLKVRQLENIKSAINKIVVEGDMLTIKGFNYYERKKMWFNIALLLLGLLISCSLFFYSKDAGIAAFLFIFMFLFRFHFKRRGEFLFTIVIWFLLKIKIYF